MSGGGLTMEIADGLVATIDRGGVVAVAILLVWRLERRMEVLAQCMRALVRELESDHRKS